MKTWQKILKGKNFSSEEIQCEAGILENSKKDMEEKLEALNGSLEGLQKNLLADSPGALEEVRSAELKISEFKNKAAAIDTVLLDLDAKHKDAEQREKTQRVMEIDREKAEIKAKSDKLINDALDHFASAAILVNELMGNELTDHNLNYDLFFRLGLSTELSAKIRAATDGHGLALHAKRAQLDRQKNHLINQPD